MITRQLPSHRKLGEKGTTMVLFTFLLVFVIVPVLGLGIDGSIVMWEKTRLSSAVDAAAYAAGRSLSVGSDVQSAKTVAGNTVTTYFNANFPHDNGQNMGVSARVTPQVPLPSNGLWTITVDATASVPLHFLRMLGFSSASLGAHSQVSRRNVNIMVVLDRSASLTLYDGGASCAAMIASAQKFTNMFVSGQDVLGLITFQTTARVDLPPGSDFKTKVVYVSGIGNVTGMSNLIGKIQCLGYTNTVSALNLAYQQIKGINQPGALNVIVFFSDGKPDAITANQFKAKKMDNRDAVAYPFTYTNNVSASSCTTGKNPMAGVIVAMDENPDSVASTLGLLPASASDINTTLPYSTALPYGLLPYPLDNGAAPGCSFSSSSNQTFHVSGSPLWCSGSSCDMRNDIESIPALDSFGNATNTGYRSLTSPAYGLFPSGAYTATYIRPDTPQGVVNASMNAAFEQIKVIRSDTTYRPVIYSIGLGQYIDTGFMQDVANDPSAPNYNSTAPAGQYVYAPTSSQLSAAFQQIASQVLRISQ